MAYIRHRNKSIRKIGVQGNGRLFFRYAQISAADMGEAENYKVYAYTEDVEEFWSSSENNIAQYSIARMRKR